MNSDSCAHRFVGANECTKTKSPHVHSALHTHTEKSRLKSEVDGFSCLTVASLSQITAQDKGMTKQVMHFISCYCQAKQGSKVDGNLKSDHGPRQGDDKASDARHLLA